MNTQRIREIRQWMADHPIRSEADMDERRIQLQAELDRAERKQGILSGVYRPGQSVLDVPQHTETAAKVLDYSMAHAFGRPIPPQVSIFEGFEREGLRWVKPPKAVGRGGNL